MRSAEPSAGGHGVSPSMVAPGSGIGISGNEPAVVEVSAVVVVEPSVATSSPSSSPPSPPRARVAATRITTTPPMITAVRVRFFLAASAWAAARRAWRPAF